LNTNQGYKGRGQHTGAWLAIHLKEVLICFELTDGCLLGIITNNGSSMYSMTWELLLTLGVSGMECPAMSYHIPCMAHVIELALGAFISTLGVTGHNKSLEAQERDQQFGDNERTDIGISQRLGKDGRARINKVLAMRPGLARIIEKVRISTDFDEPETDLHIAENSCWIDNA